MKNYNLLEEDFQSLQKESLSSIDLSISESEKRFFLSDLLPYDPSEKSKARLQHGLNEYKMLLNGMKQALTFLEKDQLASFDPLVGENACQIRALKIALIFSKYPIDTKNLSNEVQAVEQKIKFLELNLSNLIKDDLSLRDLLEIENINVKLSHNELFLIKSYLLTIVKILRPPKPEMPFVKNEYTDAKKIKEMGQVGTMFAESLIKELRRSLSLDSCQFVQEIASLLPLPKQIRTSVSQEFSICHRRLHCLPCYWTTMILMLKAYKSQIPIVLIAKQMKKDKNYDIAKEIAIFFEPTPQGYREVSSNRLNSDTPALIFLGSSCSESHNLPNRDEWKKELLEHGPIDLVLAYAASHRQYPDDSKDHLIDQIDDKRFHYYKKKAEEWGCSTENPSRFFLSHAFCDKIKNVPKHLSDSEENELSLYTS